jgi:ribosomal protein S18 acetylase RimI-like enzyme
MAQRALRPSTEGKSTGGPARGTWSRGHTQVEAATGRLSSTERSKTMIAQAIRISSTRDRQSASAALTAAFSTDPVCRWVWPNPEVYEGYFPAFISAFAGRAFDSGTAHQTGAYEGVALWLPPGVASDDEALGAVAAKTIPVERQEEVFGFLAQQAEVHPHEPHWYLPLIGVVAEHQGQGFGSALLEFALREVDRQGLPAYLEATTERNRALYERHGFAVTGVIQHGGSPPMWPMYRAAR